MSEIEYEGEEYPREATQLAGYGGGGAKALGRIHRPTITQQLEERKKGLLFELKRLNDALDALKANPEVEKVMNLVSKAL